MANIVVVEDEKDLRELIVEELVDQGHDVHEASNGAEGLALIARISPDIVLADINMPRMNGYEMRSQLVSNHPELAKRPFIFVSAYSEKSDIADGMILGASHYITKPIDFDALSGWVKSLTQANQVHPR
ncbi:MAG: response regulator [Pseudomonadota bacterium]